MAEEILQRLRREAKRQVLDPFVADEFGAVVAHMHTPTSDAWEDLESYVGKPDLVASSSDEIPALVMKAARRSARWMPDFMDARILAMMQLAEYLCLCEGDLWQICTIPAKIGITKITVRDKDEALAREYSDLFEEMNLEEVLRQAWTCVEVYGNAFILEFWDGRSPRGVTILNPKHVAVEPIADMTERPIYYAPPLSTRTQLLNSQRFMRVVNASDWNEHESYSGVVEKRGFPIPSENIYHIYHDKMAHQVYAIPPLVRAQRIISTRMMLEEMIRSTIEGVKNQIIVWTLPESTSGVNVAAQVARLTSLLNAARPARVGHLVWAHGLEAKAITPASVDRLLANETWVRLTLDIFRKLGFPLRIVSGEVANVGQSNDYNVDVQIYLDRLRTPRNRMLRWVKRFAKRYSLETGRPLPGYIGLADIDLQVQMAIQNQLKTLMGFGLPSVHTAMEKAGLVPEVELSLMKQEMQDGTRDLIRPYSGFSQIAQSGDNPPRVVESPLSPGRPAGGQDGGNNS